MGHDRGVTTFLFTIAGSHRCVQFVYKLAALSLLRSFHNELLSQVVVLLINPSQICHLQDLVHKLAILFEIAFFALTQQGLVILMSEELNAGSAELS